jgi:hypothetical protein
MNRPTNKASARQTRLHDSPANLFIVLRTHSRIKLPRSCEQRLPWDQL